MKLLTYMHVLKWILTLFSFLGSPLGTSFKYLGYVWFSESVKERKKILKKMIFLCLVVL